MVENADSIKRRAFIQASIASLALTSCSTPPPLLHKLSKATEKQKSWRRSGPSTVGIFRASYHDDLFAILKQNLSQLNIGTLKGKSVVLKPNLVDYTPDIPSITRPEILKAAIQLVDYLGASKIVVAEGPALVRDTELILQASGIGKVCREMNVPFIDLNIDDLVKVPIHDGFSNLDHLYLPKTVMQSDIMFTVPKMKTHHWLGLTCALKNILGIIPGRKYGYPKNIIMITGIPQCVMDLNHLVKTDLCLVDGITAMEGDGPLHGTAKEMGLMIIGNDPAAVDATCARIMGYDIDDLDYIHTAGEVIGNIDNIQIIGCSIKEVASKFKRPVTYLEDKALAEKLLREQPIAG